MSDLSQFRFGPFELDLGTFKLLRDGTPLSAEPKALDLLRVLLERAPRIVEKSEIFSLVWKDVAVTDNALTRLVAQLRKALDDDPKSPRYIETVATRGYRFIADVTLVPPSALGTVPDPTRAASASGNARGHPPKEWNRRRLTLVVAAIAVLIGASGWVGSRFVRPSERHRETWLTSAGVPDVARLAALRPEQLTSGQGYDGFLVFSPDGQSIAYTSDRSGALEIYIQGVAPGSAATGLTSNGRQNVQPAWSPDGQFVAYHEMAGNGLWIVPSRGGVARKISDFGSHPTWSPDGQLIAFQSLPASDINGIGFPGALSTIWIVEATGEAHARAVTNAGEPAGPHLVPAWFPDSKHLFFAVTSSRPSKNGTSLWSVDVDTRQQRQIAANEWLSPEYVVASNGKDVYFVARNYTIWWMPLGEGGAWKADPQPTGLPSAGSAIAHLTLSSDGRRVAWTTLEASNHVWASDNDTGTGDPVEHSKTVPLTRGLGIRYGLPMPSSDGRIALVGSRAGSSPNLFLLTPGTPPRQLTIDKSDHNGPQWMPGEREIAFVTDHDEGGPGFRAIDLESGRERRLFQLSDLPRPSGDSQASTAAPSTNIAFARDFTRLTMAIVSEGRPNLWVAGLRQERPDGSLVQRTFERDGGSYPAWSPDGRWIAYQCGEGTDTHVCVTGGDTGDRVQLTHEPGQSWIGGWADNDTILFAARRAAVWNIASVSRSTGAVRPLTRFTEARAYVRYPRWDAANRRAVFERSETTGRIWSVQLP